MINQEFLSSIGVTKNEDLVVGETHSVRGMVTKILTEEPGEILVEINFSIKAYLNLSTQEKVEMLKSRAFDTGFFVSTIVANDENGVVIDCHSIIFGKATKMDS